MTDKNSADGNSGKAFGEMQTGQDTGILPV